jgi:hypothetical protein
MLDESYSLWLDESFWNSRPEVADRKRTTIAPTAVLFKIGNWQSTIANA